MRPWWLFATTFAVAACGTSQSAVDHGMVEAWGAQWARVRTCLLGASPLAAEPADAFAMRAIIEPELGAAVRACGRPADALAVKELADTGNAAFASAWLDLRPTVQRLDTAWGEYLSLFGTRGVFDRARLTRPTRELGEQIANLDRRYARVREAAALPPSELLGGPPAPVRPKGTMVAVGDTVLTSGSVIVDGNTLAITARPSDGDTTVIHTVLPERVRELRHHLDVRPAAGTAGWGMVRDAAGATLAVPLASDGRPGAPTGTITRSESMFRLTGFGAGNDRLAVLLDPLVTDGYIDAELLAVFRSRDGGRSWKLVMHGGRHPSSHRLDESFGRLDLIWHDGRRWRWMRLDESSPSSPLPRGVPVPFSHGMPCRGATATWWHSGRELYYAATTETEPVRVADFGHDDRARLYCTDTGLLSVLTRATYDEVSYCDPQRCTVVYATAQLPGDARFALGPARGFVVARVAYGFLVAHRPIEDRAPRIFGRMGDHESLLGAIERDGTVYAAIVVAGGGVELVPLAL